ncbi:MAG: GNAT family N-acetyltransferase [Pyrinomonadaceae bacterium]
MSNQMGTAISMVAYQKRQESEKAARATPLGEYDRPQALDFLSRRPLNTVILSGWLREHGVVNPLNQGVFYGCRDTKGDFIGIALIGKNTFFEAHSDEAIRAFAECMRAYPDARMVFAEEETLTRFWHHYVRVGQSPRLSCQELLISIRRAPGNIDDHGDLRLATREDLDQIVAAHAELVLSETGVDPLEDDADGFRARCARRVEHGRVWVWMKSGKLIFKTDVISETPEAVYIEGLWLNPSERGEGISRQGLNSLCQRLLTGSNAICGFVDKKNAVARSLYRATGFVETHKYAKIYV